MLYVKESKAHGSTKYDVPGAILVTLGLVSLVYGFTQAAKLKNPGRSTDVLGWTDSSTLTFLGAGIILLVAFVLWNPFLYRDPVGRGIKMFEQRLNEMEQQASDYPTAVMPAGWGRWTTLLFDLARKDAPLPLAALLPVNLALALIGLWRLLRGASDWLAGHHAQPLHLVVVAAVAGTSIPALLTRLDWQRYLLIPELLLMLLLAISVGWLSDRLFSIGRGMCTRPAAA